MQTSDSTGALDKRTSDDLDALHSVYRCSVPNTHTVANQTREMYARCFGGGG